MKTCTLALLLVFSTATLAYDASGFGVGHGNIDPAPGTSTSHNLFAYGPNTAYATGQWFNGTVWTDPCAVPDLTENPISNPLPGSVDRLYLATGDIYVYSVVVGQVGLPNEQHSLMVRIDDVTYLDGAPGSPLFSVEYTWWYVQDGGDFSGACDEPDQLAINYYTARTSDPTLIEYPDVSIKVMEAGGVVRTMEHDVDGWWVLPGAAPQGSYVIVLNDSVQTRSGLYIQCFHGDEPCNSSADFARFDDGVRLSDGASFVCENEEDTFYCGDVARTGFRILGLNRDTQ